MHLLHQLSGYLLGRVGLGQIDGIDLGVLEAGQRVPLPGVEREAGSIAPFVAEGVEARVDIGCPGVNVLTADDVDHTTDGIRAIEGRRGTLYNLDAPHVVEVHAGVVDIVHGLTSHAFAINEEEHGVAAKAAHVEGCLLGHGKSELQSGNLLREHVLDIGGIGNLDVVEGDQSRDDWRILQGLWRVGSSDHNRVQLYRVAEGCLCRERNNWHGQSHASQEGICKLSQQLMCHNLLSGTCKLSFKSKGHIAVFLCKRHNHVLVTEDDGDVTNSISFLSPIGSFYGTLVFGELTCNRVAALGQGDSLYRKCWDCHHAFAIFGKGHINSYVGSFGKLNGLATFFCLSHHCESFRACVGTCYLRGYGSLGIVITTAARACTKHDGHCGHHHCHKTFNFHLFTFLFF